ncbi:MAG: SCO family protein [Proteobacteria bacterium]|nr:SCO family protein [Pseudomonadota bacterium]NBY19008.1 SCO family protein [bacterium]
MKKKLALGLTLLFFMPIIAIGVLLAFNAFQHKELPVITTLPSFTFTERTGQDYGSQDLKNKVWVGSFIFTSCSAQCPLIITELQKIQRALRFKDNFRIVSFTLDPLTDTPKRLSEYATQAKADPYKWLFLTAENKKTQDLIQKGFILPSLESEKADGDIVHSSKLVLVDGGGRVRGYYDSVESTEMKQLLKDAKRLIRGTY